MQYGFNVKSGTILRAYMASPVGFDQLTGPVGLLCAWAGALLYLDHIQNRPLDLHGSLRVEGRSLFCIAHWVWHSYVYVYVAFFCYFYTRHL